MCEIVWGEGYKGCPPLLSKKYLYQFVFKYKILMLAIPLPLVLRDIRDKKHSSQKNISRYQFCIQYKILKLAICHLIVSRRIFKCNIFKIFSEGELPGPPFSFTPKPLNPPIVNLGYVRKYFWSKLRCPYIFNLVRVYFKSTHI